MVSSAKFNGEYQTSLTARTTFHKIKFALNLDPDVAQTAQTAQTLFLVFTVHGQLHERNVTGLIWVTSTHHSCLVGNVHLFSLNDIHKR